MSDNLIGTWLWNVINILLLDVNAANAWVDLAIKFVSLISTVVFIVYLIRKSLKNDGKIDAKEADEIIGALTKLDDKIREIQKDEQEH